MIRPDGRPTSDRARTDARQIAVLRGKGDGSFAARLNLPAGAALLALAFADLDADGQLDLLAVARDADKLVVVRNKTV